MHRIVVAVVFASALGMVACGGKSSPPPQTAGSASGTGSGEGSGAASASAAPAPADDDNGELMLAKLRAYKTEVCACKDAACVEAAQREIMDWAVAHAEELKDVKATPAQDEEATKLDGEIEACEAKVAGDGTGSGVGGGGAMGGTGAAPSITATEILAKMAEYKNRVCACKDMACVEKVEEDMAEWARANMDAMMKLTPTKAEDAQADKIQADMTACREKLEKKK